jgi:hypothetical protein
MPAFLKNLLVMCFILLPIIILFGMILFSGKPKDMREREAAAKKADCADRP